jgi:hypothetical protein
MTEKRSAQRQRTLKGAVIVFNNKNSTLSCTVRNASDGGAQIRVASTLGVPDQFELRLSDGTRKNCTVVWRKAEEMGVRFGD